MYRTKNVITNVTGLGPMPNMPYSILNVELNFCNTELEKHYYRSDGVLSRSHPFLEGWDLLCKGNERSILIEKKLCQWFESCDWIMIWLITLMIDPLIELFCSKSSLLNYFFIKSPSFPVARYKIFYCQ